MAKTGTGPAGRPPRNQPKITEGQYPDIYQRWLKGTSVHSLAAEYHVDWSTMQHHLQKCRMMLKTTLLRDRNEVLDELALVRAAAWECFKKSQRPLTHDEVAKEIDRVALEKGVSKEIAERVVKQTTKITTRDGEANWLSVVLAADDLEARMTGHYETGKREGQKQGGKGSYRAAGRSPSETHEVMAQRLVNVLTQRREALVGGSN
jgi:DNA-binding transcriptional ArsR family regulator